MSVFRNTDSIARQRLAREATAAVYARSDAAEEITTGDWAGFTTADATAWCWNLYQYEPHGFVYPASAVRQGREQVLEEGGIPEGGGYAAKARKYIEKGTNKLQGPAELVWVEDDDRSGDSGVDLEAAGVAIAGLALLGLTVATVAGSRLSAAK